MSSSSSIADAGLVYPPPLDTKKDESAAGVGAFSLQESSRPADATPAPKVKAVDADGKWISSKEVRQTIKSISATVEDDVDVDMPNADSNPEEADEDFVLQPSHSNPQETVALPTLQALSSLPQPISTKLFSPYTFWLSRETSRPIFEFLVRSFGGRIGWPVTSGSGSPITEEDESITHVIIDRPLIVKENETEEERERRRRRKYVQPQWVVDCINAGKILLEEPYAQGNSLPPHLSPFEDRAGAYDPTAAADGDIAMEDEEESEIEDASEPEADSDEEEVDAEKTALKAAASAEDEAALRAAELEAEAAGIDFGTFEKTARKAKKKKAKTSETPVVDESEQEMNKMMMSNKQKKLYERMKYGEKKRTAEVRIYFISLCRK